MQATVLFLSLFICTPSPPPFDGITVQFVRRIDANELRISFLANVIKAFNVFVDKEKTCIVTRVKICNELYFSFIGG